MVGTGHDAEVLEIEAESWHRLQCPPKLEQVANKIEVLAVGHAKTLNGRLRGQEVNHVAVGRIDRIDFNDLKLGFPSVSFVSCVTFSSLSSCSLTCLKSKTEAVSPRYCRYSESAGIATDYAVEVR